MGRLRLRTKFLIAMLLTSAGLTAVSLLIVQHTVANHVRGGLSSDLADSVETLSQSAARARGRFGASGRTDGRSSQPEGAHDLAPRSHHSGRFAGNVLSLGRRSVCAAGSRPTSSSASIPSLPAFRANRRSGCWTVAALWMNRCNGGLPADICMKSCWRQSILVRNRTTLCWAWWPWAMK